MKLIAIDLDGTLLSLHNQISKENIEALRNAQNAGHVIMICSGRAPEDIEQILKQAEFSCPVAGSNGTVVKLDGKVIQNISMNAEDTEQVVMKLDEEWVPYRIYTNDGIFVPTDWSARVAKVLEGNAIKVEGIPEELFRRMTEKPQQSDIIKYFHDYHELFATDQLTVQKFFVLTLNNEVKAELTAYMERITGVISTTSGPYNIEIMDRNGNKGVALRAAAAYYGIPMTDTVAMGDNFNDVPMLQAAGLSIAMGNADPEVKKMSDTVTLTNEENGVAYAIEKFILR